MESSHIPSRAPRDKIMATHSEVQVMLDWTEKSFKSATLTPFSFIYDGVPSEEFLHNWKHKATQRKLGDRIEYTATWADPGTGLVVTAVASAFKDYPAADWALYFENTGKQDTPIIESIQAVDMGIETRGKQQVTLHQLHGDSCNQDSFQPFDRVLEPGKSISMAPTGGRPSQASAFPFWNFQYGDEGVITAVGWSGQWAASYDRSEDGATRFRAGMEKTHLLLHPGEKIRAPRILLMTWKGDRLAAHNRFRRLMLFHYVPKQDGKPLRLPTALQTFDRYHSRPGWATEAGQLQCIEMGHRLDCDTFWLDAAWFPGGFPNGVGNWSARPEEFPRGLKPLSDLAHKYGIQFMLWVEPCRVAPGTMVAREHPEFVFGGEKGGLFNLGNPEAQKWMTDLLSGLIGDWGIDVYREDYNIDPLSFWRDNDAPDRQGMNEIRFVEGHYAMWDELRRRHPGLWIDNCASGGRRIDLETCMRAVPIWRSDTNCSPSHSEWNQSQSAGLCQYVPLHTACAWKPERYEMRSSGTGGALFQADYLDEGFPFEKAKAMMAELKENRKYWYGDFYPLTPVNAAPDQFMAFQFHRADLDEGLALAFRRPECETESLTVSLHGLTPKAGYLFEFVDEFGKRTTKTMTGKEIELRIPEKAQSLMVRYKRAAAR